MRLFLMFALSIVLIALNAYADDNHKHGEKKDKHKKVEHQKVRQPERVINSGHRIEKPAVQVSGHQSIPNVVNSDLPVKKTTTGRLSAAERKNEARSKEYNRHPYDKTAVRREEPAGSTHKSRKEATPNVGSVDLHSAGYSNLNPLVKAGYGGQCTAFVWGRVYETTGKKLNTTSTAKNWITQTSLPKGKMPKKYSIAVWGGTQKNAAGHVAFVEGVQSNGDVVINEANVKTYPTGGGYDGAPKVLTQEEMDYRSGAGKLLGYIYLE